MNWIRKLSSSHFIFISFYIWRVVFSSWFVLFVWTSFWRRVVVDCWRILFLDAWGDNGGKELHCRFLFFFSSLISFLLLVVVILLEIEEKKIKYRKQLKWKNNNKSAQSNKMRKKQENWLKKKIRERRKSHDIDLNRFLFSFFSYFFSCLSEIKEDKKYTQEGKT